MEVTVKFFGVFRKLGDSLTLVLPGGAVVADIRNVLCKEIKRIDAGFNVDVVGGSRFASDVEILDEACSLEPNSFVTVIPPVSGG